MCSHVGSIFPWAPHLKVLPLQQTGEFYLTLCPSMFVIEINVVLGTIPTYSTLLLAGVVMIVHQTNAP